MELPTTADKNLQAMQNNSKSLKKGNQTQQNTEGKG
jgi:hypothetical protein